MPIPTMLTLTATPTFPGDPAEATPTLTDMTDDSQVDSDHDGTTKVCWLRVFHCGTRVERVFPTLDSTRGCVHRRRSFCTHFLPTSQVSTTRQVSSSSLTSPIAD